ncbi:glycosyltransferase family 2 protein [Paraglaciecola sp. L1A13]|uniref:glycosyltransferase family 2 protein n=1 Tax=Paraglaciecola sp. L1A13 TaxID=2686359 RepID=UPI00131EBDE8|nr:glycosyltransferase family 2 protein [Paraglaciecola sp. L1A13]
MPILVSLICPVYKVAQYIPELMQSLFEGINTDKVEIIFVDDCCPENSITLVEQFIAEHKQALKFNPSIIKQPINQGQAAARNKALAVAQGQYIGFIDSDDAIAPHYWKTLEPYVERAKNDIIEFGFTEFTTVLPDVNDTVISELPSSNLNPFHTGFFVWTRLYNRDTLNDLRFPKGMIYEDIWFNIHAFSKAQTSVRISSTLVYYRKRAGSTTALRTSKYSDLLVNLITAIQQTIDNTHQKRELVSQLQKRTFLLMLKGLKISDKADRKIYYQLCYPKMIEVNKLVKQHGSNIIGKINYSLSCLICRFFK